MNKKMREITNQISTITNQAKAFMADGEGKDVSKASELMDKVAELQKELEVEKAIDNAVKAEVNADEIVTEAKAADGAEAFAKGVRTLVKGAGVSMTSTNGKLTIPADVQTKVNKRLQESCSLINFVTVEKVQAPTGTRVFQTRGHASKFLTTAEAAKYTNKLDGPAFEKLDYAVTKRTAYTAASQELADDSDANIIGMLTEWIADAENETANEQIVNLAKTAEDTDFKNLDGLKKAVIKDLAAFNDIAIYTNGSGMLYLDTLKDGNGRPLLQQDPTAKANFTIRCGVKMVPVRYVPDDVLADEETAVPFIIGDLKSGIIKFDRQDCTITASREAAIGDVNAFETDSIILKASERDDWKVLDSKAFVRGHITVEG